MIAALLLAVLPALADPPATNDTAAGQALAEQIRSAVPEERTDFHAVLSNRANGQTWTVPVVCRVAVHEDSWETDYQTAATTNAGAERLLVIHRANGANRVPLRPRPRSRRAAARAGGDPGRASRRHVLGRLGFLAGGPGPGIPALAAAAPIARRPAVTMSWASHVMSWKAATRRRAESCASFLILTGKATDCSLPRATTRTAI